MSDIQEEQLSLPTVLRRVDARLKKRVRTKGEGLLSEAATRIEELEDAAHDALKHVQELREAWQRGVIEERDGRGGMRSNRNVDVEVKLRCVLAQRETR